MKVCKCNESAATSSACDHRSMHRCVQTGSANQVIDHLFAPTRDKKKKATLSCRSGN